MQIFTEYLRAQSRDYIRRRLLDITPQEYAEMTPDERRFYDAERKRLLQLQEV